jgi:ribosome-associated protein
MSSRKDIADRRRSEESMRDSLEPRLSRAQQTRAAAAVTRLGQALALLSTRDLDRLELPERLREEIDVCRRLKPRSRGRQNRLIGQLLRVEDHEAIRVRVESLKRPDGASVQREKGTEAWRDRIIEQGDAAVEALMNEYPEADRQRLRLLARNATHGPESKTSKRARLELLRALRALRE